MTRVSKAIRLQVQRRANGRCEYCGMPDTVLFYTHHFDHIIAPRHGGLDDLDNLAWSCFMCNTAKGTDIATYDPLTDALVPLYNPRNQDWDEHFAFDGPIIAGKTPIGRGTVQVLQLNDREQVEYRRNFMDDGIW